MRRYSASTFSALLISVVVHIAECQQRPSRENLTVRVRNQNCSGLGACRGALRDRLRHNTGTAPEALCQGTLASIYTVSGDRVPIIIPLAPDS